VRWNDLAQWIGETGSGTWDQFKETYLWLTAPDGPDNREKPYRVALKLSGLGYLEINWDDGRWAAAKPCITLLPSAGGAGLLVGGRTRYLLRQLEKQTGEAETLAVVPHRFNQDAPDAVFFTADLDALEKLANDLEISFEFNIAERLSLLLQPLSEVILLGQTGAPPPQGFEISRWIAPGWKTMNQTSSPGLYKSGSFGRRRYWFLDEKGDYHSVDGPTGFYAELSRVNEQVLRYRNESINGTLYRPIWAPIPLLQERAAVLCSGLTPTVANPDASFEQLRMRYENVPHEIARRVALSLGTRLEELN